jgi:hypothetical protein
MASPWALERFGGLPGAIGKRLPQAIGTALERTLARRAATETPTETTAEADAGRRRALRHSVLFAGTSNQGSLDTRWGEPSILDDRY